MLLPTLDIALRGATVALLLVLAASLFRGFGTVLKVLHALDQTNPVVPGRQANGWRFRTR